LVVSARRQEPSTLCRTAWLSFTKKEKCTSPPKKRVTHRNFISTWMCFFKDSWRNTSNTLKPPRRSKHFSVTLLQDITHCAAEFQKNNWAAPRKTTKFWHPEKAQLTKFGMVFHLLSENSHGTRRNSSRPKPCFRASNMITLLKTAPF
jgi:hypothetical protein